MAVWDLNDPGSPTILSNFTLRLGLRLGRSEEKEFFLYWGPRQRYLVLAGWSAQLFVVSQRILKRSDQKPGEARFVNIGFDVHEIDWKKGEARCVDDGCLNGLALEI